MKLLKTLILGNGILNFISFLFVVYASLNGNDNAGDVFAMILGFDVISVISLYLTFPLLSQLD